MKKPLPNHQNKKMAKISKNDIIRKKISFTNKPRTEIPNIFYHIRTYETRLSTLENLKKNQITKIKKI